jgi:serine/threonine protein kinase
MCACVLVLTSHGCISTVSLLASSQSENGAASLDRIATASFELPDTISERARDLIARILRRRPEERITVAQIWDHPWCVCVCVCVYNLTLTHSAVNAPRVFLPVSHMHSHS